MPASTETSAQRVFGSGVGMMSRAARDRAVSQVAFQNAVPLAKLNEVTARCVMSSSARRFARTNRIWTDVAGRELDQERNHEVGSMLAITPLASQNERHDGRNARVHGGERGRDAKYALPKVSLAGAGAGVGMPGFGSLTPSAKTPNSEPRGSLALSMPTRDRASVEPSALGSTKKIAKPIEDCIDVPNDSAFQNAGSSQVRVPRALQASLTRSSASIASSSVIGNRTVGLDLLTAPRPTLASSQGVAVSGSMLSSTSVAAPVAPRPRGMERAQTNILARRYGDGVAMGSRDEWSELAPDVISSDGAANNLGDRAGGQPDTRTGFEGNILLDGALVGRWISRLLTRDAERASVGRTGFDIRRGRLLPGPTVGGA